MPRTDAPRPDMLGKISCHASGTPKTQKVPYAKKLWDGYEISLGPARNSEGDGDECTGAIYNSAGHAVFRTTGFSVIFDAVRRRAPAVAPGRTVSILVALAMVVAGAA